MKSLSEKFVLIILLLQPCLAVPELVDVSQLEFGDILTFPRCYGAYDHYAIFVDNREIADRPQGTNIFEKIKDNTGDNNACRFNTVTGNVTRNNYLDSPTLPRQTDAEIIATIERLNGNKTECGPWRLTNNCEHTATLIQHGEAYAQCNQPGTLAGYCSFLFHNRRQRRSKESRNLHQGEIAAAA